MTEKIRFPIHQRKLVDGEVWNIYRYHVLDRGNAVPCVRIITPRSAFCPTEFAPLNEGLQKIKPKKIHVGPNSDIEIVVSSDWARDAICVLFEKYPTIPKTREPEPQNKPQIYCAKLGGRNYFVTRNLEKLEIAGSELPLIMEQLIRGCFPTVYVRRYGNELEPANRILIIDDKARLDKFENAVFPPEERQKI